MEGLEKEAKSTFEKFTAINEYISKYLKPATSVYE